MDVFNQKGELLIHLKKEQKNKIYVEFKELFLTHYTPLCRYAFRYIKDADGAEDVVQDVFTSIWAHRDSIDFSLPIKPLLYKYTRNKALNYLKSSASNAVQLNFDLLDKYVESLVINQIESQLNVKDLNQEIQKSIDKLPKQCQKVYNLSRVSNLKNKEIAANLNINIKTVEKHISKALSEIRDHLCKKGLLSALALFFFRLNE